MFDDEVSTLKRNHCLNYSASEKKLKSIKSPWNYNEQQLHLQLQWKPLIAQAKSVMLQLDQQNLSYFFYEDLTKF